MADRIMDTAASARSLDLNQLSAEAIIYQFADVLVVINHRRVRSPVVSAFARSKQLSRGHRAGVRMLHWAAGHTHEHYAS